jgi:hypothetical protein
MAVMKNELLSTTAQTQLDDFDNYTEDAEGQEEEFRPRGSIEGDRIAFTNNAEWINKRTGEPIPPDLQLIVARIDRVVDEWGLEKNKPPLQTIRLTPGEKWPDVKAWNEKAPPETWRKGPDGKMHGPFQKQRIVYFWDPATLAKYTWTAGDTIGGRICIEDLTDKIKMMRRIRGERVFATVALSDTFMPTNFGGRQRPHLIVQRDRWVTLDDCAALPETKAPAPALIGPATIEAKPAEAQPSRAAEAEVEEKSERVGAALDHFAGRTVEPPTLKEELKDEIPW